MIRWLVRLARQPVSAMTPSECIDEQLEVHARLAAVQALEEALAGQRREVLEALVVGRQQRQVVALDLAVAHVAVVDEVRLEPEQGLDVVLLGGLVELDRAVHDAVVGQADGRLIEGGGALGELADVARAVEQRVLGVDVQVRDGRGAHRGGNHRRRGGRLPRIRPPARCAPAICGVQNVVGVYEALGVRRVVNACGIYTDLGGSVLSPSVWAAAAEANATWASMDELLDAAGARVAALCGAPAARVVPGASAGIALSVGACIARGDGRVAEALPRVDAVVLMQRGHEYKYARCATLAGARVEWVDEIAAALARGGACGGPAPRPPRRRGALPLVGRRAARAGRGRAGRRRRRLPELPVVRAGTLVNRR